MGVDGGVQWSPKWGVPFSWVIGSRRWAFTFTPASVAATGWDEGIYLIILYGRRSLDDGSKGFIPGGSYATFDGLGSDEIHGKPLDR
ncbi:hypothetical protein WN944_023901 [Citrus x changshan-huyou]|uniref:Uncharacterized protein n=1 Tax=Citrus x changshan-huyou TaxID=2935761 RepID=A0AAP0LMP9_9ROSI